MAPELDSVRNNSWSATHHDPADENRPGAKLTTQAARQGETSGHMRLVLAVSLVLAVIAGIIVYGVQQ
jgi:hypothetical protein